MRSVLIALVALAALVPSAAPACNGDCNGDGSVGIDELVLAVQIALGGEDLERCAAADHDGDGVISITDLIDAVESAVNACPASTPTPTATPDPGLKDCGDGTVNGTEECDDGNRVSDDGCSADCALEPGGDPCVGMAAFPGVPASSTLITDALSQPVDIEAPALDPHRLFVIEQAGRIRIVKDGILLDDPFLAIESRVSCCGERGLLGVAFDPGFETNGRFFVYYTNPSGTLTIARYRVGSDADHADRDSEQILLTVPHPMINHNGGHLRFGPGGYLYIGLGDGGGGGDPGENAQDDGKLLGKLLRLDVNVDSEPYYRVPSDNPHPDRGAPLGLIWAKGLRNPWRFSFDRASRDLYIADVGQDRFEEIDVQPADSHGGENYGWDIFEANACFEPDPFPTCPDPPTGFTFPVYDYDHRQGCSVTGGFVYRGCALPDLHGQYFFSDYCTPFMRTFELVGGEVTNLQDRSVALAPGGGRSFNDIVSFGEDARGELYIADYDGELYKVVPRSVPPP